MQEEQGIVKNIDNLGRLIIPKNLRDKYNISTDTPIFIQDLGKGKINLVITKFLVCPKCDKILENDSIYCKYCGIKVH